MLADAQRWSHGTRLALLLLIPPDALVTTRIADVISARPIIVHSHLRWDFEWQRPQQLCSRFAHSRDVLYVEAPQFLDDVVKAVVDRSEPHPNVHRIIPRLPSAYRDSESATLTTVRALLLDLVGATGELPHRFDTPIQWFFTPMPAPTMLGAFGEGAVVYDCMDDVVPPRSAPVERAPRERYLLARADVVFSSSRVLADASWDNITSEMTMLMEEAVSKRRYQGAF